jgi:hypothetical protein
MSSAAHSKGVAALMRGSASLKHLCQTVATPWVDVLRFSVACVRSRSALAAENLFLRKRLALYRERQVRPRRASDAIRVGLVLLARCFAWRDALVIVQPETLLRWHRQGFRLFWWWWSTPRGRPRVPADLCRLIRAMAQGNPTWHRGVESGGFGREAWRGRRDMLDVAGEVGHCAVVVVCAIFESGRLGPSAGGAMESRTINSTLTSTVCGVGIPFSLAMR